MTSKTEGLGLNLNLDFELSTAHHTAAAQHSTLQAMSMGTPSPPETVSVDMDFCSSLRIDAAPGCAAELLSGLFQVSQTRRGRQVEKRS